MGEWSYDGSPIQSGTGSHQYALSGEVPHYSIIGLREMVVVARYYTDDPNNRSKKFVEYSCRDLHTSEVYPGCRQLSAMGGVDDGDDNTLHPTSSLLEGATGPTGELNREQALARDSDGDQVLVGFVDGSRNRPVIIGVFRQIGSKTYGATEAQGERRLTQHKGTSLEIQDDGTYVITHKSGSKMTFNSDGSVDIVPANGAVIHNGDPNAFDAEIRGTTYRAAEDILLTALGVFATALGSLDPTTAPEAAVTLNAAIAAFQAAATTYLSTKVTVST